MPEGGLEQGAHGLIAGWADQSGILAPWGCDCSFLGTFPPLATWALTRASNSFPQPICPTGCKPLWNSSQHGHLYMTQKCYDFLQQATFLFHLQKLFFCISFWPATMWKPHNQSFTCLTSWLLSRTQQQNQHMIFSTVSVLLS